jgi:hypothetical protein
MQCLAPFGIEAAIEAIESLQGASDGWIQQKALALEHAQLESGLVTLQEGPEQPLTEKQKRELLSFARDLPKLWDDSQSLPEHRKRLLRIALKEIIATSEGDTIRLLLHWQGGDHTQVEFQKARSGRHRYVTDDDLVGIVRMLARIEPDARIASILNRNQRCTAHGQNWTAKRVCSLRNNHAIPVYREGERQVRSEMSVSEGAAALGVTPTSDHAADNMKQMKLLVSEMRALSSYISREFHYTMTELVQVHGWKQMETFELWNRPGSLRDRLLRKFGELPSVILFWEGYGFFRTVLTGLRELGCRTCIFADDLHWDGELTRSTKLMAYVTCDVILPAYEPVFERFYPGLHRTKKIVWAPHAASPDFILPVNENPRTAVLVSGRIHDGYPLRQKMQRLYESGKYSIDMIEHPRSYSCTYDYDRDASVGNGYARSIRSRLSGFTCAARYHYTVAKFFEIPATGSLLLADASVRDALCRLGFAEYEHYVPADGDRLEVAIEFVLDPTNRAVVDRIRRAGQELVCARHTTNHRARLIDEACSSV